MRDTLGIALSLVLAPVPAVSRDSVALVAPPPLVTASVAVRTSSSPSRLSTCYENRYGECWSED